MKCNFRQHSRWCTEHSPTPSVENLRFRSYRTNLSCHSRNEISCSHRTTCTYCIHPPTLLSGGSKIAHPRHSFLTTGSAEYEKDCWFGKERYISLITYKLVCGRCISSAVLRLQPSHPQGSNPIKASVFFATLWSTHLRRSGEYREVNALLWYLATALRLVKILTAGRVTCCSLSTAEEIRSSANPNPIWNC